MFTAVQKAIILTCVLILTSPPVCAQNIVNLFKVTPLPEKTTINDSNYNKTLFTAPPLAVPKKKSTGNADYNRIFFTSPLLAKNQSRPAINLIQYYEKSDRAFWDFIDKEIYEDNYKKREEKTILREAWKEWLGIDVWYPYFKAKEIEEWIRDRTKIKIFRFRGRAKFERNRIIYTFKMQF
jgi:hypothetical protein